MHQLNLKHLALRKGLNTFACDTTFRCSSSCAGLVPRKSRSLAVDLRSDRQAGIYETIRHSRDAFKYPHRGSLGLSRLPLITKTRGFVEPVARLACDFSKVLNYLAEVVFRNAFCHQLQKCLAPVRQHGYAMHLEGDWRTRASGCSAVGGRSTCVQTVRLEHMKRFDTVEMFSIAPHRGNQHSPGLPLISKTWRFCATGAACSRTATGTAPVAVRGRQGRG